MTESLADGALHSVSTYGDFALQPCGSASPEECLVLRHQDRLEIDILLKELRSIRAAPAYEAFWVDEAHRRR